MKKPIKNYIKLIFAMLAMAGLISFMSGCTCDRTHYDPRMKQVGCGLYQIDCNYCGCTRTCSH